MGESVFVPSNIPPSVNFARPLSKWNREYFSRVAGVARNSLSPYGLALAFQDDEVCAESGGPLL
jgi:hypothetical protein